MWEAMNTLVQVSVVDSAQQGKTAAEGKNHLIHRRRTPQDRDGPLLSHFDLSFSENSLFSVYCFIKDYIGSQTAPEKIPSSAEVGHDVEPPAGSAASAGSNTVAIDNKIEQAMDLVKSHLMFAVREEVEVLKEKISELLERISQLEHENDILRANASAETLKQLNNQSHKKILSGQSVKPQPTPPQPSTT